MDIEEINDHILSLPKLNWFYGMEIAQKDGGNFKEGTVPLIPIPKH